MKKKDKMRKQSIGILSLGCPRNLVDSENIIGRLRLKGHSIVDMEDADVAIINTCAFIEEARQESVQSILGLVELKKEGRLKKIIVYGCLTQRYKYILKQELPEIDAFVGRISLNHSLERFPITPRHYVYLKICEGCINNCSFCIIPKIKGKFNSLDKATLLRQVDGFNKDRVSEINCIGQDITGYGMDLYGSMKLSEVLREITRRMDNVGWLRLLYLHPIRLTDDLLKVVKDEPKICKYIDLPIQHINDRLLKLMHRGIKKKDILRLIDKIRKVIPQVCLRTSVIVGFPSETQKEFKELLSFLQDVRFERLGAFIYSREEGTLAYHFKGQIPRKTKSERLNSVMSYQQKVSREVNARFLGKTLEVLIDEKEKDGYLGRTQYDAPEVDGLVYVKSDRELTPGDFVSVKITDTLEYDLVGEV
ncbi:MAG: MiaB/RimO family radical SAM methylthiotransferase [Candidatus Omnitrophota bacterium]